MSARTTTGNSSPLALCTVIRRTPSLPSSTTGASGASLRSAASRSASTKPRNEMPPSASYCRASSTTCSTFASTRSPAGRMTKSRAPACARAAARASRPRDNDCCRACSVLQQSTAPRRPASGARGRSSGTSNGWNRCRGCGCQYSSSASSPIANSAPRSVAYTFSASSGHSIAASAARSVSTSSRSWNERPPTSRCGTLRASSASTYGRVMSSPQLDEAAEQDADVPRLDRHLRPPCLAPLGDRPAALATSQCTHAPTASGKRRLDRRHGDVPLPVGIGDGQDDDGSAGRRARLRALGFSLQASRQTRPEACIRNADPVSLCSRELLGRPPCSRSRPCAARAPRSRPAATHASRCMAGAKAALTACWIVGTVRKFVRRWTRRAPC